MEQLPKYRILADTLRQAIMQGTYRPGDQLETENALVTRYAMSRQTVRQALDVLSSEGLIIRRQGSGTYVRGADRASIGEKRVGVITTYITEYIFPSILRGIESALSAGGCVMELSATDNRVEAERRILLEYLKKPIDGLIVKGTKTALPNPNIPLYEAFAKRGIPIVFFNGYYQDLRESVYVVTDDEAGGAQAARYLLDKGHRALGGIFKSDDLQGHRRYKGFMGEMIKEDGGIGREYATLWFDTENQEAMTSGHGAEALLQKKFRHCTGIVCYNDIIATDILQAMERLSMRMPEDMALVSFDHSAYAGVGHGAIPSLGHPKEKLGRIAAEKLLGMIEGKPEKPVVLPFAEFFTEN